MTEDTLAKALADVRQRRSELQAEYDRIGAELTKLRRAEAGLAAIVEGMPLDGGDPPAAHAHGAAGDGPGPRAVGRGSRGPRGPRANSAKGRLKALLRESGPQGLTQAEISRRLPEVAAGTLNSYLSVLVTSGEAERRGDFYTAGTLSEAAGPSPEEVEPGEDAPDEAQA